MAKYIVNYENLAMQFDTWIPKGHFKVSATENREELEIGISKTQLLIVNSPLLWIYVSRTKNLISLVTNNVLFKDIKLQDGYQSFQMLSDTNTVAVT